MARTTSMGTSPAFATGLKLGDKVTRGQLIGYVGDTGNPGPATTTSTSRCTQRAAMRLIHTRC